MMDTRISIIGIGNAGCKIVDALADVVKPGQSLIAINTDKVSLAESRATTKVEIGAGRTRGLGAGGDVNLGKIAAEDDLSMVAGLLVDTHLVFVVAGLGGGTGTGATPVILEAAREAGAVTLCFGVLPFEFEDEQRMRRAEKALETLQEAADALIVVRNGKILESDAKKSLLETMTTANGAIAGGIASIFKLVTQPGIISLSFADLQRVLRNNAGLCTFGYSTGSGSGKAAAAVKALLTGRMLDEGRVIAAAKSLLVSIVGGSDFTVKEMNDAVGAIKAAAGGGCSLALGTVIDEEWTGRCSVTIVAADEVRGAAETVAADEPVSLPAGKKTGRAAAVQTTMNLDPLSRGIFKGTFSTEHEGEDLDKPTFLRRGISVEK